jgi:hypothetical protein
MSKIRFTKFLEPENPTVGRVIIWVDIDGRLKQKDENGNVIDLTTKTSETTSTSIFGGKRYINTEGSHSGNITDMTVFFSTQGLFGNISYDLHDPSTAYNSSNNTGQIITFVRDDQDTEDFSIIINGGINDSELPEVLYPGECFTIESFNTKWKITHF